MGIAPPSANPPRKCWRSLRKRNRDFACLGHATLGFRFRVQGAPSLEPAESSRSPGEWRFLGGAGLSTSPWNTRVRLNAGLEEKEKSPTSAPSSSMGIGRPFDPRYRRGRRQKNPTPPAAKDRTGPAPFASRDVLPRTARRTLATCFKINSKGVIIRSVACATSNHCTRQRHRESHPARQAGHHLRRRSEELVLDAVLLSTPWARFRRSKTTAPTGLAPYDGPRRLRHRGRRRVGGARRLEHAQARARASTTRRRGPGYGARRTRPPTWWRRRSEGAVRLHAHRNASREERRSTTSIPHATATPTRRPQGDRGRCARLFRSDMPRRSRDQSLTRPSAAAPPACGIAI